MAEIAESIKRQALDAVRVLSTLGHVQSAYIFGSHAEGRADKWSDIDVAAFMHGIEKWSFERRARAMALVFRDVSADVEAHVYPASSEDNPIPASFSKYILEHGVRIYSDHSSQ